MPLYNVRIVQETVAVVFAPDAATAETVGRDFGRRAFDDDFSADPQASVLGEVTSLKHLRDGWDGDCIPYGRTDDDTIKQIIGEN